MKFSQGQGHNKTNQLPTARLVRRTCNKELYRTVKRLGVWIPPDKMQAAENLYFQKVIPKLVWVFENRSNRKILADWWSENVSPEIAQLWDVDSDKLSDAFRKAFGG